MRRAALPFLLALIAPFALRAQTPYLVKDINVTTAEYPASSMPYLFFRYGSRIIFDAVAPTGGVELWSTDGTQAGTTQLSNFGRTPSHPVPGPSSFAVVNGKLLFTGTDLAHGSELWTTDGTNAGTHLLADIASGQRGSFPGDRIVYHDRMIFAADDGIDGSELWITDGTAAGTMFFKDLVPGPNGSSPGWFVLFNDLIYFGAADGLWKSDGTPNGTVVVKGGVTAGPLTVAGSRLFFNGYTSQTGEEPWVSDGAEAGTHMITQITPPRGPAFFTFTPFGNRALFVAYDQQHGEEPWISDGTAAGTHMLLDINPGRASSVSSDPSFTVIGDEAFFVASNEDQGGAIWKTDGSQAGTTLLPGTSKSGATGLVAVGTKLYFVAPFSVSVGTLWVADSVAGGAWPVKTSDPHLVIPTLTGPHMLTNIDGVLYFPGANSLNGYEPWKSDGTDSGTVMIANLAPDLSPGSGPANLTAAGDWVYFDAWDGFGTVSQGIGVPRSLWRSDGTPEGTLKLTDSPTLGYVAVGHSLFFNKNGQLWTSDGTPEGTRPATAFANRFPTVPVILGVLGDKIYASVAGTLWVTTIASDAPAVSLGAPAPSELIDVAGHDMFFSKGGLWTSDGTPGGTYAVVPSLGESGASGHAIMAGALYFGTFGNGQPFELWRSDGTFEGTVVVRSFPGSVLGVFVAAGRSLFVDIGSQFANEDQQWVTDGTDAGTRPLPTTSMGGFAAIGNRVVFPASDSTNGTELWVSDGTDAGTHLVRDIFPGAVSSYPASLTAVDGTVYFSAMDDVHLNELWMTDGTAEGTTLVADIEPGFDSSSPRQFVRAGDRLFFTAYTSATGRELWALPLPSTPRLAIDDTRVTEGNSGTTTARFTVTLSRAASQTVTVAYATSDGSAQAGSDYDAVSGTLTFAPGETLKTIDVSVHGDVTLETNETFFVTLSNATGATLTKSQGFGIIDDDDGVADVGLALDFSQFFISDVIATASNNGPRTATNLKVSHTATPVTVAASTCRFVCSAPPAQLVPGATVRVFDNLGLGFQQYLTVSATARQNDPQPSNNSVGWMTHDFLAMDTLYLTPGSHANVWVSNFLALASVSMESSDPAIISVPGSLALGTTLAASFVANGVSPGTATIRVYTPTATVGTLTVDVLAPGVKRRWPGALNGSPDSLSVPLDKRVNFRIYAVATAPYVGQTATGVVTIHANGQELGRTTLPAGGGERDVLVYLPDIGTSTVTVDYAGDANFLPMTIPSSLFATRGSVTISASANRSGTTATIHLRVTGSPMAAPTGTISVSEPGVIPSTQANLTAATGAGQADITLTNVSSGQHTFVANYSGDTRYNAGTQNVRLLEEHRHVGPH
jgi:ELWxxDGT repeat protein